MKRQLRNALPLTLCGSLALAICTVSLSASRVARAAPPAPAAAAKSSFQIDFVALLDDAQKKIMSLEDAVPQAKFTWRPAPGVRSIAEAYLHIAFGNYGITKRALGKEPPADAGWEMNIEKWDKKTTDKAEIKKILEKSFDHVREAVKALPDADLEKSVNLFGSQMTERAALIGLIAHVNEHLGQSIAYARANKVVPPWSKPTDMAKGKDKDAKDTKEKDKEKK
jgi:uncharacterized damage-inducible protein DinB